MRIPDINRLSKCNELLSRVIHNLDIVLVNMGKQKLYDTKAYSEIEDYRNDVGRINAFLSHTMREACEDVPEEQWKNYNNKLL